ncbi:MAG: ABC transporter permease [Armatimonadota bacterium]
MARSVSVSQGNPVSLPGRAPAGRSAGVWRRFVRHRPAVIGAAVIGTIGLLALLAPVLAPYSFGAIDIRHTLAPPGGRHLLGTDDVGRDVLTRLMFAGRVSLTVGLVTTAIGSVLGAAIGLLAGFYRGLVDTLLTRAIELFLTVPPLAMMFVLAGYLGPGLRTIVIVLALFGWMFTARLVRGEVLRVRALEFIDAARVLGVSDGRIMLRHLLPNVMAPVIVSASAAVGQAILAESTISYFGLGIQPPVATWGNMLRNAQEYLFSSPWLAMLPGCAIFLTVMAFNLLGDGLRDALDPRSGMRS